jgi:DNA polymerase III alpha subunit
MDKKSFGDIDIDVANRELLLELLDYTNASIIKENTIDKHNTGIYVQDVPVDPITGLCSINYEQAEELGYIKLDVLNMNSYQDVKDEEHLKSLLAREPMWDLLEHEEIVEQLPHIHGHFNIVNKMKPKSVEQLAMVLAIIRPGKRKLLGKSWAEVAKDVWVKHPTDKYSFKKSHATSYALLIVTQLNLLVEKLES